MAPVELELLPGDYTVSRLSPGPEGLDWLKQLPGSSRDFISITQTREELSVVSRSDFGLPRARFERGWCVLRVKGPLDFSLVGILAGIAGVLSNAGIPLFCVSTYDTDYFLVKELRLEETVHALRTAGYRVDESTEAGGGVGEDAV